MSTKRLDALIAQKEHIKAQLATELGELKPVLAKIASNPMSALSLLSGGAETIAPAARHAMAMIDTLEEITHEIGMLFSSLEKRVEELENRVEQLA